MDFNAIQMENTLIREQIKQKYGMQAKMLEIEYSQKKFDLQQKMKQELISSQKMYEKQLEAYQQERDKRKQELLKQSSNEQV